MAVQLRTTQQSIGNRSLQGLQGSINRLGQLQEQLTTGKQISRPSDSPTGTVSSMQLRSDIRSATQQIRNADDGLGWLGTIDTQLTSASSQLLRARDLTLQGMSSGTASSPEAREALAVEIDNLRASLIDVANTKYLDRPVFGGTTAGGVAYNQDGTYAGDTGEVMRTVSDGPPIRVDAAGPDVFGAGNDSLFAVMDQLSRDLRSGNLAGLNTGLGKLDAASNTIKGQISDVGARYNRIENTRTTAEDKILSLRTQLSDVEDIDLPATIMQLQLQQVAYEAALAATGKVVQPSLMDFLR